MSKEILAETLGQLRKAITALPSGKTSDEVKNYILSGEGKVTLRCDKGSGGKSTVEDGVSVNFPESTFCRLSFIQQDLEKKYGKDGRILGWLLAVSFYATPFSKESLYDKNIKTLLSDIKILSVGDDPALADYSLNKRFGIEPIDIGQSDTTIGARRELPNYIDLTTANPEDCPYVYACNVVSPGGNRGGDKAISETLATMVQMLKPQTGRLLCVNSYDYKDGKPDSHISLKDAEFHTSINASMRRITQVMPEVFEFTRVSEKLITPLEFAHAYQSFADRLNRDREYTFPR